MIDYGAEIPGKGAMPGMKDHPQRTARLQLIEAMRAGHSWQSAVEQSHLQVSRSTAYRLVQLARNEEQAALVVGEGRHGHAYKVTQPVQAWLVEVCTTDPQVPSCRLQAELEATFGITVSIGHLNRLRAQHGLTKPGCGRGAGPGKKN
jgi:transposase